MWFKILLKKTILKDSQTVVTVKPTDLFLPGQTGCWRRKFACFSCPSCKTGGWRTATDPMKGIILSQNKKQLFEAVKMRIVDRGPISNSRKVSSFEHYTSEIFYAQKGSSSRKLSCD